LKESTWEFGLRGSPAIAENAPTTGENLSNYKPPKVTPNFVTPSDAVRVRQLSLIGLRARGKAGRLIMEFGHFQDFVRINKSLLSTKAERDLGLWPRTRPGGYGLIRAGVHTDSMIGVTKFRT
jgi:hypothetical protein